MSISLSPVVNRKQNHLFIMCVCAQNGQTPLMLAAEQGSLEIVQELVRRGANVNLDDVVGETNTSSSV